MKCRVEWTEGHYDQTDYQTAFEEWKKDTEKPVQPAEHHNLQYAFQKFAESRESSYDSDKYQCEWNYFQNLLRSFDILRKPGACGGGELEWQENAGQYGYNGDYLGYESFSQSLYEGWNETYENYDVQYIHLSIKKCVYLRIEKIRGRIFWMQK